MAETEEDIQRPPTLLLPVPGYSYTHTQDDTGKQHVTVYNRRGETVGTAHRPGEGKRWHPQVKSDNVAGTAGSEEAAAQRIAEHHAALYGERVYQPQLDDLGRDPVYVVHNTEGTYAVGVNDEDLTAVVALRAAGFSDNRGPWQLRGAWLPETRKDRVELFQQQMLLVGRTIQDVRDAEERRTPLLPGETASQRVRPDARAQASPPVPAAAAPSVTQDPDDPDRLSLFRQDPPAPTTTEVATRSNAQVAHREQPEALTRAFESSVEKWLQQASDAFHDVVPPAAQNGQTLRDVLGDALPQWQEAIRATLHDALPQWQEAIRTTLNETLQEQRADQLNTALDDADKHSSVLSGVSEWLHVQQIRQAARNLWATAKEKIGTFWSDLKLDERWNGFWNSIAAHSTDAFARLSGAAAQKLNILAAEVRGVSIEIGDAAGALQRLSHKASAYSTRQQGQATAQQSTGTAAPRDAKLPQATPTPTPPSPATPSTPAAPSTASTKSTPQQTGPSQPQPTSQVKHTKPASPAPYTEQEARQAARQIESAMEAFIQTQLGAPVRDPKHRGNVDPDASPHITELRAAWRGRAKHKNFPRDTAQAVGAYQRVAEAGKNYVAYAEKRGRFPREDIKNLKTLVNRVEEHTGRLSVTLPSSPAAARNQQSRQQSQRRPGTSAAVNPGPTRRGSAASI